MFRVSVPRSQGTTGSRLIACHTGDCTARASLKEQKGALLCIRHVTHIAGIFFSRCASVLHALAAILFRLVSLASFPSFPSSVLSSMLLFASPPSPFLIVGFVRVNFARLRFAHVLAFGFSRQLFHFLFSFHRWLSVHRSFFSFCFGSRLVGDLGYLHPSSFPRVSFWLR